MHTFFINTSKKDLNACDVLFDIQYENKTLVSMECLMSDWYNKDDGYIACVKQMSDMIDGYVELNNAFNLILYIDLPEIEAYASIPRDAFHDKERDECCRAMHVLFTHVINESIVQELISSGRRPQNVLIMFGEERKFTDFFVASNDPGRPGIMKKVFGFIGLPSPEVVENAAKTVQKTETDDKVNSFRNVILEQCGEELVPGIRDRYHDELQLWCDEIINEADIPKADSSLFERISSINKVESDRIGIEIISCPYDCYASKVNKSVLALSKLNVALHLLKCVELNSIFESADDEYSKRLIEFHSYTVQEIALVLKAKKDIYSEKVAEIESSTKSYAELNLAPELSLFDYNKFGLDKYGDKATELVITDVIPEKEEKKAVKGDGASDKDAGNDDTIVKDDNKKEVNIVQKQGRVLLTGDEYEPFDYNYKDGRDQMLKKNTTPEQYIEQAMKLRKHHLDYLKKLKIHVSKVLSNYAGKSKENKPALLQMGGYRYATPGKEKETRVLEEVECISDKAYESMINQYMKFCAGRSVAISDIEEQCNWFVSKVNQIRESLKKIKLVAIGLLIAIIVLYIPFVVIQFEAITENFLTFLTALGSIAVPMALLYVIFAVIVAAQKKKYLKAWKEFQEKSDQALEENKIAVQKYDQLLSVVVPALRWVYEYKLDVDYCAECCSVADAKMEHHRLKLHDRVASIQNLLSDLEFKESEKEESKRKKVNAENAVDYDVAFCSGEKNCSFYSVIDSKTLAQSKN